MIQIQLKMILVDPTNPTIRKVTVNQGDDDKLEHDLKIVQSIPYKLWLKIAEWGAETGLLSINLQSKAKEIAHDLKFDHKLSSSSVNRGMTIFDKVCEENYELLEEADILLKEEQFEIEQRKIQQSIVNNVNINEIDIDMVLISKMVEFDRRKKVLDDWKFKIMQDVVLGLRPLTEKLKHGFRLNLKALLNRGFRLDQYELVNVVMDILSLVQRHNNMKAIGSKNTKPEIIVRKGLWKRGFRYRLNYKRLPGHPDIVLRKYRTCIFVNGCFWHGHFVEMDKMENSVCCKIPMTNHDFGSLKFAEIKNEIKRSRESWQKWAGTV